MRISDWSSDVCSSDLAVGGDARALHRAARVFLLASRDRPVGKVDIGEPFGELQRGFEAVGEPRAEALPDRDTVDDDFDVMLRFFVDSLIIPDLVELVFVTDAREDVLMLLFAFLLILSLSDPP